MIRWASQSIRTGSSSNVLKARTKSVFSESKNGTDGAELRTKGSDRSWVSGQFNHLVM
jgi:hypothetical protein